MKKENVKYQPKDLSQGYWVERSKLGHPHQYALVPVPPLLLAAIDSLLGKFGLHFHADEFLSSMFMMAEAKDEFTPLANGYLDEMAEFLENYLLEKKLRKNASKNVLGFRALIGKFISEFTNVMTGFGLYEDNLFPYRFDSWVGQYIIKLKRIPAGQPMEAEQLVMPPWYIHCPRYGVFDEDNCTTA